MNYTFIDGTNRATLVNQTCC